MVPSVWVRSHVPHALPIGEWVFWNLLVFLEVAVKISDVFCVDAPAICWLDECQSSCNVHSTQKVSVSPHDARNDRVNILWVVPELPVAVRVVGSCGDRLWHDRLLDSAVGGQ